MGVLPPGCYELRPNCVYIKDAQGMLIWQESAAQLLCDHGKRIACEAEQTQESRGIAWVLSTSALLIIFNPAAV